MHAAKQNIRDAEKREGKRNLARRRQLNRWIRLRAGGENDGQPEDKKPEAAEDKKPVEEDKKPVEEDKKPEESDAKPEESDAKPEDENAKPDTKAEIPDYALELGPSSAIVNFTLKKNQRVTCDPGAMIMMCRVKMEKTSSGGIWKGLTRVFTSGQSFFQNTYVAEEDNAQLMIGTDVPGDILAYELPGFADGKPGEMNLVGANYLASDTGVDVDSKWGGWNLSGVSLILLRCTNSTPTPKTLFIKSFGGIKEINVDGTAPVTVDNENILGWTPSLTYKTVASGTFKSFLFGGEGFVMEFTGTGTIWVQTRSARALAGKMWKYLKSNVQKIEPDCCGEIRKNMD